MRASHSVGKKHARVRLPSAPVLQQFPSKLTCINIRCPKKMTWRGGGGGGGELQGCVFK